MNKTFSIIVLALIIIGAGWYYYGQSSSSVDNGVVKVGVIAPLTGQYGFLGEGVKNSVSLVLGEDSKFQVIFEDNEFDVKKGVSAYQKLVNIDKVDVLMNVDAATLSAIQPLVKNTNIPVFEIFESNFHEPDNIFQILPFSYPLFTELAKESGNRYNKVALVYSGAADIFSTNADFFKKGIESTKIVYEAKLGADPAYKTEATKVLAAKPDAVTLMMAPEEGIQFVKALIDQGAKGKIKLICDANIEISIQQYVDAVGKDIFEGCISTNLPGIASEEFTQAYKTKFNTEPPFGAVYAFDAATIVKTLAMQPKTKWFAVIQKTKITGASGPLSFDESGTRLPQSELHIFQDGKFVKAAE